MPHTWTPLQRLQESFRRAIKADAEDGTLLKTKHEPTTFYPEDCKRKINESFCKRVFDLLVSSDPSWGPGVRDKQIENHCKKICPGLRVTFMILFAFTPREDLKTALDLFQEKVLENNTDLSDKSLPLEKAYAKELFGESAGKAFFNSQPKFLPITLQGGDFRQILPTSSILPWFDEADSVLGEGAYGTVHKVKIVRGYFVFKEPRSRNADVSKRNEPCTTRYVARLTKIKRPSFLQEKTFVQMATQTSKPRMQFFRNSCVQQVAPRALCSRSAA